jgi:hypothetical protein
MDEQEYTDWLEQYRLLDEQERAEADLREQEAA